MGYCGDLLITRHFTEKTHDSCFFTAPWGKSLCSMMSSHHASCVAPYPSGPVWQSSRRPQPHLRMGPHLRPLTPSSLPQAIRMPTLSLMTPSWRAEMTRWLYLKASSPQWWRNQPWLWLASSSPSGLPSPLLTSKPAGPLKCSHVGGPFCLSFDHSVNIS